MKIFENFTGTINVDGVVFNYKGSHREWNPLPGHTPPSGTLWEVVAENLPFFQGSASGIGGSKEEALESLKRVIRKIRDYEQ